jgi:hypothetical protein
VFLGALAIVTLLLTAFGSGSPEVVNTPVQPLPAPPTATRPEPRPLASVGNLQIVMPIAAQAITGIGYHDRGGGALELRPAGRQANEGVLSRLWRKISGGGGSSPVWYQLGGPGTTIVAVGAEAGTEVYAPVSGTVIGMNEIVFGGVAVGSRIDIRPTAAPAVRVAVSNVRPDPGLTVGSTVISPSTKIGTSVDIAAVEEQALAAHARDDGNNISISVFPASGSLP